jgi:hypothetical protein
VSAAGAGGGVGVGIAYGRVALRAARVFADELPPLLVAGDVVLPFLCCREHPPATFAVTPVRTTEKSKRDKIEEGTAIRRRGESGPSTVQG